MEPLILIWTTRRFHITTISCASSQPPKRDTFSKSNVFTFSLFHLLIRKLAHSTKYSNMRKNIVTALPHWLRSQEGRNMLRWLNKMPTKSHSIAILPTAKLNFIRRIQYVVHNNCTVVPGLCAGLVCRFLPRSGHITKGSLLTSSYFLLYTLRTMCHPNPHTLQSQK